ncbi:MAG TPA: S46 family peptidase [Bacteroidales bacterium]|nr:S46 family peptidase [Bacteroidales bacterium]
MKKYAYLLIILFTINFTLKADEGMWIPLFLGQINEAEMQAMGMNITAEDIYSINQSSLKDAIVIFGGGCTGELVSDQGLLLTNHHCGYRQIQKHSSVDHDYLTNGFWAMERSEELPNPGLKVTFLVRMEEVTDAVLNGVNAQMTEEERNKIIEENIETIKAEAIKGTHFQALIKPFYYGNRYFLFVNEIYEDVRLVGAPPSNIGKFGGDTDNWVWPRHTGDFSMFRIYADKDNNPAPYSEDNVPYQPKKHMNISLAGVEPGDFTFVFGYPGSTEEYIPSWAVETTVDVINPIRIQLRGKRIDIFKKYMNEDPAVRIQYAAKQAGISNGWKKWIGENRGIKRLKAVEQKQAFESSFSEWVNSSEELKEKYGSLLEALKITYEELADISFYSTYLYEAGLGVEAIRYSRSFDRLVDFSKANGETQEELMQLVDRQKSGAKTFFKDYQAVIDHEVFVALLSDYYDHLTNEHIPDYLAELHKKYKGDFNKMADVLFEKSIFVSEQKVDDLLNNYKASNYKKIEKDPVYQLAQSFADLYYNKYMPQIRAVNNNIDSLMRVYMQAQIDMQPMKNIYPDANFTLRVAYGNVDGYNPDDAVIFNYFTTLDGIMEKENPDIYDYVVGDKLKDLYHNENYGQYGDADGKMHVCFTATNHTTGGNSGSPVLDADGNLIGINFDRCWEGTMSDIIYDKSQCRNIALDIRYCLFIIDKFAGAGHLVEEMTLVD